MMSRTPFLALLRRLAALLAGAAVVAACGTDADPVVPFGPGLQIWSEVTPLTAGVPAVLHSGWAANVPAPPFRLQWRAQDSSTVRIDSVSADTRTAYVRPLVPGAAVLEVTNLETKLGLVVSIPVR